MSTVIQLTPPNFTPANIGARITCTRPTRKESMNISVKMQNGKKIVHCYGHGGSGFTILVGSVQRAIELFEKSHPNKHEPIRVVGSGCVGLCSAIELCRKGYAVTGIASAELYDIPSWKAGGYFAIAFMQTSLEELQNLYEIGRSTFLTYQQIERGEHPYISKEAVQFMPVYCSKDTDAGLEFLEGLIPPLEYVTLDFGNGVTHSGFVKYMSYFMNTSIIMNQMMDEINRLSISIDLINIRSFDEVTEDIVFNCTGIGAGELNQDTNINGVRGHLILFNENADDKHMNYMIATTVQQNGADEFIDVFPKNALDTKNKVIHCNGLIGGTTIPNTNVLSAEDLEKLDQMEFDKLLERVSIFFTGKSFSSH